MCGRYALYGPHSRYHDQFGAPWTLDMAPRFNAAPSQLLPVLRQDPENRREFLLARWGLAPAWAKPGMPQPINAKTETAAEKPMFRHALRKSRVLVPADGFYEWQQVAGGKQPYLIHMKNGVPFGMAGLLEQGPEGEVASFAILTTTANRLMAQIHARMPAIVEPGDYDRWLDSSVTDAALLTRLLGPYPDAAMEAYRVSRRVNSPASDDPGLIEALADG